MRSTIIISLLAFRLDYGESCLPGPFGFGFAPRYNRGYVGGIRPPIAPSVMGPGIGVPGMGVPGMGVSGMGVPGMGGPGMGLPGAGMPFGPRIGPFRSDKSHGAASGSSISQQEASQFAAQYDNVHRLTSLNCPSFLDTSQCRWGNVNDDELDWSAAANTPEVERYFGMLGVSNYPDRTAAVLVSAMRQGWEGGHLISDPLPCLNEDVKLTATAWRTKDTNVIDEPKLQVCTRNEGEERFPLVNCNDFPIRNGVPMAVDVPTPNNPALPAQIVINGYNFLAPAGGAIFLQDIVVEGTLTCNGEVAEPTLIDSNRLKAFREDNLRNAPTFPDSLNGIKSFDGQSALEAINAAPQPPKDIPKTSTVVQPAPPAPPVVPVVSAEMFESCISLSCNPSDLSCKFWRSSGNNRWEIGSANRIANPLTGIHAPPPSASKYLVAPFVDNKVSTYTLVSEALTIPPLLPVYFCFYEYYATQGLSLAVCNNSMDCFYRKTSLVLGQQLEENRKWNMRCAKLPSGTYELRVIAENMGSNKGEVGFLPIRLTRDAAGFDNIC